MRRRGPTDGREYVPGAHSPVIEKTDCRECVHREVCYFRMKGERPETEKRTVEAFGTIITIEECIHFLEGRRKDG